MLFTGCENRPRDIAKPTLRGRIGKEGEWEDLWEREMCGRGRERVESVFKDHLRHVYRSLCSHAKHVHRLRGHTVGRLRGHVAHRCKALE